MFSNFGNINDMTKSQFQKAIEYYQNKIKTMTEDKDISDDAKHWFLHQYNERLKSLQNALEELDLAINRARNSSAFVDELRATLSGMGTISSSYNNFDNLAQDEHRYRVSQGWKIAGAILLPLVGTIPFLRSWNAARKRHNAIEAKINSENVELGNFVSKEKRPYEATLLTSTKFTEEEMANLLEDTAELSRIANLVTATPSPITPVQRKNLISKLVDVREFGQKNGYNVGSILTNPAFKTSVDKTLDKTTTHETAYNSINSTAATLKQAYDSIKQLEELRTKVQELYNSSKEQRLETLLSNIDSKIATLKTHAKTKINAGVNDIVTNINNETGRPTGGGNPTETTLTNAINAVNGFVNNANPTHFGTGVNAEQARRMAEELFTAESDEYKKFGEIDPAKTAKINEFETEREKVVSKNEINTHFGTFKSYLQNTHNFIKLDVNSTNTSTLKYLLEIVEAKYKYLKENETALTEAQRVEFFELERRFEARRNLINEQHFRIVSQPENFPTLESTINNTIVDDSTSLDDLRQYKFNLENAKATLSTPAYIEKMKKLNTNIETRINILISTAESKINDINKRITLKETSANTQTDINKYQAEITAFKLNSSNESIYIENKSKITNASKRLNEILDWINSIKASTIDTVTLTTLNALKTNVEKGLEFLTAANEKMSTADLQRAIKDRLKTKPSKDSELDVLITLGKDLDSRISGMADKTLAKVNAQETLNELNEYLESKGKSLS